MRIAGICKDHGYYKGKKCLKCKDNNSAPFVFVRTEAGYRTDVEFSKTTIGDSIREMNATPN